MITVIAGYPASGKTTCARKLAAESGGVVMDLDALAAAVVGTDIHAREAGDRRVALAINGVFWRLAEALEARGLEVYAIRTAPGEAEYIQHVRHCARIVMIRDKRACLADAAARPDFDRDNFEAACRAVDDMLARGRWAWEACRAEEP